MPKFVQITLPDGSKKQLVKGASVADLAASIGQRLAKDALAGIVDGQAIDLDFKLEKDSTVKILTWNDKQGKQVFWHSTAHVLAMAVKELFPKAQLTIGPPIEEGFYYDFYFDNGYTFKPDDLEKIEKKMKEIAEKNFPSTRHVWSKEEALDYYAKKDNNPFKKELIKEMEGKITYYTTGKFIDLCKGPHIPAIGKIKAVKLLKVSASYWRGNSQRETLQRIYAISFPEEKMLKEHLQRLEEAEKRDHRKLGKELDLFSFHDLSPGSAFFHAKGAIIYNLLQQFMRNEYKKRGYAEVLTPNIFDKDLWVVSGHWEHYKENMFSFPSEGKTFALKPMNCPGHCLLYKTKSHSYKELPIRFADFGVLHRNELSGVLGGLTRVRKLTQDDAHIFCTQEQIESEISNLLEFVDYIYAKMFDFEYHVELSTRPEKFIGAINLWDKAETALKAVLAKKKVKYVLNEGDGAFYGPKIDFHIKDALGRNWQCATIQLDFNQPERFDLVYKGADDKEHRPVIIHRAILGSLERFIGVLVEHYAGHFPLWLSPEQIRVIPVSDKHIDYAEKVATVFEKENFRVHVDKNTETVEYKIRESQLQKIPYVLVVGDKELEKETVAVRKSQLDKVQFGIKLHDLLKELKTQVEEKK